jgi:hypothetical protein
MHLSKVIFFNIKINKHERTRTRTKKEMASLGDVYGDDFAKEMLAKNYDYLKKPTPPEPPPPTPEQIEDAKQKSKKFAKAISAVINFGDSIKIGALCYETFPCQHKCNGKLQGAREIYKLLQNTGFIHEIDDNSTENKLTKEQDNFIKHISWQLI